MVYRLQRLLAEEGGQIASTEDSGQGHTSPGGAPSMNAEIAETLFKAIVSLEIYLDCCRLCRMGELEAG